MRPARAEKLAHPHLNPFDFAQDRLSPVGDCVAISRGIEINMIHPTLSIVRKKFRDNIVDFEVNMFVIFHCPSNFGIATQSLDGGRLDRGERIEMYALVQEPPLLFSPVAGAKIQRGVAGLQGLLVRLMD